MPKLKHIHQIVRVPRSKTQFKCAYPMCSYVWAKRYILGNLSICNGCFQEFVLDSYALSRALPKCIKCRNVQRDTSNKVSFLDIDEQKKAHLKKSFVEQLDNLNILVEEAPKDVKH